MSELLLFFVCFMLGAVSRALFKLVTMLENHTRLIAVTVILDFSLTAIITAAYATIIFFMCDGMILSYSVAALILGFVLIATFF